MLISSTSQPLPPARATASARAHPFFFHSTNRNTENDPPTFPFFATARRASTHRAQVEASLAWRVETGVAADQRREPWDVSGCASEEKFDQLCRTYYPHYTLGTDRLGRPVLVQKVCSDLSVCLSIYLSVCLSV